MFTGLTSLLIANLARALEVVELSVQRPLQERRFIAARLLEHYATFREVEGALAEAWQLLNGLAQQTREPTGVILSRRLGSVASSVSDLGRSMIGLYGRATAPSLQRDPWLIPLNGPKSFWLRRLTVANLYPVMCPLVEAADRRARFIVTYPAALPEIEPAHWLHARVRSLAPQANEVIEQQLRDELRQRMAYQTVDVRDPQALARTIATMPANLQTLAAHREAFAAAIQQHISLPALLGP